MLKGVLLSTYTQRGRYYHNLNHIRDLLIQAEKHRELIVYPVEFTVAILFHDTVYELHRQDNEERSAALAHALAPQIFTNVNLDVVNTYIMATTHKSVVKFNEWTDAQLLADMDLWTFGEDYETFAMYSKFVDAEFLTAVPSELYKQGRKAFLQGMLDRPYFYYLNVYSSKQARQNIQRALTELDG